MSLESNDLTIRQDKAIAALLTCRTIAEAAKLAQVGERSIYRWLKQDTFQSHLRRARRQALSQALGRLQQVADRAVDTLGEPTTSGLDREPCSPSGKALFTYANLWKPAFLTS